MCLKPYQPHRTTAIYNYITSIRCHSHSVPRMSYQPSFPQFVPPVLATLIHSPKGVPIFFVDLPRKSFNAQNQDVSRIPPSPFSLNLLRSYRPLSRRVEHVLVLTSSLASFATVYSFAIFPSALCSTPSHSLENPESGTIEELNCRLKHLTKNLIQELSILLAALAHTHQEPRLSGAPRIAHGTGCREGKVIL
jgi:hypothetical protein